MKTAGIYLHMPFCKSKCVYCNFHSYTDKGALIPAYIDALEMELLSYAPRFNETEIRSVYFGGGTPSVVGSKHIAQLLKTINENYKLTSDAEITFEINPASGAPKYIEELKNSGINRVSVGLQTANDTILKILKRPHTARDFTTTVNLLKKKGFENISADIMLGLPYQTLDDVKKTLKLIFSLGITHLSAYGLKLEKGTPLYVVKDWVGALPDEDASVDMYDYVYSECEAHKLYRYEVSNFARVDYESRHNLNYWDWGRYLGAGAGAHSFIFDTRSSNIRDIEKYISRLNEGKGVVSTRHKLSLEEAMEEYIMLALRKDDGLDVDRFNNIFCTDLLKKMGAKFERLEKIGAIVYDNHTVNIKPDKMYVMNSIICDFLA